MTCVERIPELCAQLLRAENPFVIETVAAQLQMAIDEYVRHAKCTLPVSAITSLNPETM